MESSIHHEGLTIEDAKMQAIEVVQFTLLGYPPEPLPDGSIRDLEAIAFEIAGDLGEIDLSNISQTQRMPKFSAIRTSLKRWARRRMPNSAASGTYRKIGPNFSWIVNDFIYQATSKYKETWRQRSFDGDLRFALDQDVLTVWFVHHLVYSVLNRDPTYAAAGVLRVLFNYPVSELLRIVDELDVKYIGRDEYRKRKKLIIGHLVSWFGTELLKTETLARDELQFIEAPISDESFELVRQSLRMAFPRIPVCILSEGLDKGLGEAATILCEHACPDCRPHSEEREKMHAMTCTDCLAAVLHVLQLRKLPARLRRPDFRIKEAGGTEGDPPTGRSDIFKRSEEQYEKLKEELRRKDQRRQKMSLNSVIISIVNGPRRSFSLNEPATIKIPLDSGQHFIKIEAEDEQGPLTLETRYVPWDSDMPDPSSLKFTTKLKGRRRIKFSVEALTNESGELKNAVLNVDYSPPVPLPVRVAQTIGAAIAVSALLASVKELVSRRRSRTVERSSLVTNLLAAFIIGLGVLLLVGSYLFRSNSPKLSAAANRTDSALSTKNPSNRDRDMEVWSLKTAQSGDNKVNLSGEDSRLVIFNLRTRERFSIPISDSGTVELPELGADSYRFAVEAGNTRYVENVKFPLNDRTSINLRRISENHSARSSKKGIANASKRGRGNRIRSPHSGLTLVREGTSL